MIPEEEYVAEALRETYWNRQDPEYVKKRPWDKAGPSSKAAWTAVALQARDLWEGIPR